ncbi:hypothetical protein OIU78_006765 [Salix suchowensis]|nr:hypothetical protein OIU78_006765 [Salix suchowensis]
MSITGLSSDTGRPYKKSLHRRNDSEELDVFEAARYFSGYNEGGAGYNGAMCTQKVMREDHKHSWRGGRMSLDVPNEKSTTSSSPTPPPYTHINHTKSYKEFRSNSDHRQIVSLPEQKGIAKSMAFRNEMLDDKKSTDLSWLEEKYKFTDGFSYDQNVPKNRGSQHLEKDRPWVDQYPSEEKECRKFDEVDDGTESDSSSDLFELQNYDLGSYSNGLPVYETTRMDSIKRGALPISNGNL